MEPREQANRTIAEPAWRVRESGWPAAIGRHLPSFMTPALRRVHHYLVVRLGSRTDADDVLQETFVRLAPTKRSLCL